MKFYLILTAIILIAFSGLTIAHDNKIHTHTSERQWNLKNSPKPVKGSLLILKDGIVYLEKSGGEVIEYPLASFTKADQIFVKQKYEQIKNLNLSDSHKKGLSVKSITDPLFIESAFIPFKPDVATNWDENYFYVESLGMAEHTMMTGITSWQQQVPIPQCYVSDNAWSIPLNPVLADSPLSLQENLMRGAVAIAANGVPIFNPLNNRGEDAYLVGELDDYGGHSGRADDYHYHIAPLHLQDKTENVLPIAFALDGYAIYGSEEPDGSLMEPLDQYNGHTGSDGVYHYHGTETYPYIMGSMVGEVVTDNNDMESQILPQASTIPVRDFLQPLQGAVITGFEQTGDNSYSLVYTIDNQDYTVNYNWTSEGQYNFEFVNPDGSSRSESYQGFIPCEVISGVTSITGSVTRGPATTVIENLFDCGRVAGIGTITAGDNTVWTVPAEVNFRNSEFPFASDLHNPCNGATYNNTAEALAQLNGSDIVEVDTDGEVITAYVFADNYFEMYINGVPVGKDNVPFTQFNSDIVRFKVKKPFTIAVKLVDWEENLGLGSEDNRGFAYSPGDGGLVASFYDQSGNNIAITNSKWKAQTYYIAPLQSLECFNEVGNERLSTDCSTQGTNDGSNFYAVHYPVPSGWFDEDFDDSSWPDAYTYTNQTVGVDNKQAYTNFTDVFDDPADNAEFIWSSNLILDNLVLTRYTVEGETTGLLGQEDENLPASYCLNQNYPNPFNPATTISYSIPYSVISTGGRNLKDFSASGNSLTPRNDKLHVSLKVYDILSREVATLVNEYQHPGNYEVKFDGSSLSSGIYYYKLEAGGFTQTKKLMLLK